MIIKKMQKLKKFLSFLLTFSIYFSAKTEQVKASDISKKKIAIAVVTLITLSLAIGNRKNLISFVTSKFKKKHKKPPLEIDEKKDESKNEHENENKFECLDENKEENKYENRYEEEHEDEEETDICSYSEETLKKAKNIRNKILALNKKILKCKNDDHFMNYCCDTKFELSFLVKGHKVTSYLDFFASIFYEEEGKNNYSSLFGKNTEYIKNIVRNIKEKGENWYYGITSFFMMSSDGDEEFSGAHRNFIREYNHIKLRIGDEFDVLIKTIFPFVRKKITKRVDFCCENCENINIESYSIENFEAIKCENYKTFVKVNILKNLFHNTHFYLLILMLSPKTVTEKSKLKGMLLDSDLKALEEKFFKIANKLENDIKKIDIKKINTDMNKRKNNRKVFYSDDDKIKTLLAEYEKKGKIENPLKKMEDLVDFFEKFNKEEKIPVLNYFSVYKLCNETKKLFEKEESILHEINDVETLICASDIHGDLKSFFKIVRYFLKKFKETKGKVVICFLGDSIDPPAFSSDCYSDPLNLLIFTQILKFLFPENVVLVRGNHETRYGCCSQELIYYLSERYKSNLVIDLYELYHSFFNYLPIATIVNNEIFCVHGWFCDNYFYEYIFSKKINLMNTIKLFKKPFSGCPFGESQEINFGKEKISTLEENLLKLPSIWLWSKYNVASAKFLAENNLKFIIKGHNHKNNTYNCFATVYSGDEQFARSKDEDTSKTDQKEVYDCDAKSCVAVFEGNKLKHYPILDNGIMEIDICRYIDSKYSGDFNWK
ncbi:MAG: metallophosphoesterase [Firmicutes bacterium]|nr:metallophosphoesterase [Bacillota bacterium]